MEKVQHNNHRSPAPLMGTAQMRSDDESTAATMTTTSMRTAETLLRLIPIAPCIAALVVMLHNSQTNDFGSISYSHLGAFKYLVHMNGICAGYSLVSAVIAAMRRPFKMSQAWTFFILDQVMTYLVLGGGAVSTEVLYLAFEGDTAITWSSACSSFSVFCHKATVSVAVTYVVVACYVVVSLISSYNLFTNYDAPADSNANADADAKPSAANIQVTSFHA